MLELDDKKLTYRAATLQVLSNMSEAQLQSRIIEPLLRLAGFTNVRDNSGSGEKGKDLTAVLYELGKAKLYSIQIKKLKLTGKAYGTRSLNNLVSQLRQTMLEPVFDRLSNSNRIPNRGIFITPFQINREALESAIQQVAELERREITIIDGPMLLDLVLQKMPNAIPEIGPEVIYRMRLAQVADRIPESTAFGLEEDLSLDNMYVDVEVMPGTSKKLFISDDNKFVPFIKSELEYIRHFYDSWIKQKPPVLIPPRTKPSKSQLEKLMNSRLEKDIVIAEVDLASINESYQVSMEKFARELLAISKPPINILELNSKISEGINISKDFRSIINIPILNCLWPRLSQPSLMPFTKVPISISSEIISDIEYPVFITGEPGSGKTTLLRRITQKISRSKENTLPILLYLVRMKELSEEALVNDCIHELNALGYETDKEDFLIGVDAGKYRLLLDGLDETGALSEPFFENIQHFSNKHPKCPIIVTCRDTLTLDIWSNAFYLHLSKFDDEHIRKLIDNWFKAEPSLSKSLNNWLFENQDMKQIVRTPVMLAVLCSLYNAEAEIPTTVSGLYEGRFDLLLGKWEKVKNIAPLPLSTRDKYMHFLITLAMHMHKEEKRHLNMDEIIKYYHIGYASDVEMLNAGKVKDEGYAMIIDCIHRGLLFRETTDVVSFGHLTYQEFLTAKYLCRENPISFILRNIKSSWWYKTFQFYATLQKDITRLLQLYLQDNTTIDLYTLEVLRSLAKLAPLTNKRTLGRLISLSRIK